MPRVDPLTGLLFLLGLALLVVGADLLVKSAALALARAVGVSELTIALTVVALGTSLPEVATSLLAAARGDRDIAVGNAIGSNLFNILWVLGLTVVLSPAGIAVSPAARNFDLPVMVAVAVACLPIFANGSRIARWEGALFLAYYLAYTLYLVLRAQEHHLLPAYSATMLRFALPLTALTLLIVTWRHVRARAV